MEKRAKLDCNTCTKYTITLDKVSNVKTHKRSVDPMKQPIPRLPICQNAVAKTFNKTLLSLRGKYNTLVYVVQDLLYLNKKILHGYD